MPGQVMSEIKIKLPSNVAKTMTQREIVGALYDKSFARAEYYRSKCNEFREKYGKTYAAFRKKVESSKQEKFQEWDDLLLWEGYEFALKEWKKRQAELKNYLSGKV